MSSRDAKVEVPYWNGMAAMKDEFFTWKDVREIPHSLGSPEIDRQMKLNPTMGSTPTHSSQTDEKNVASSVGPGGSHPKVWRNSRMKLENCWPRCWVQHYKQPPLSTWQIVSFCSLGGSGEDPGTLEKKASLPLVQYPIKNSTISHYAKITF